MARPGGATATPVTGDPRGQRGTPPTAYTPGGHQWGSELEIPERGGAKSRAISPSVPSPTQGPRETHTYPWACQSGLGGLPAWPSVGSFHCGERRRGDGGPGNRTLRPLWQDLTRAGLTRKLPLGTAPAPRSWAPDCRRVPTLLLPRARGLSPSPAPSRASTRSFLTLPWDPWSIYSPQLTPSTYPWGILFPSSPSPCTSLSPFYLLGRGRGEGTGRRDSPCPRVGVCVTVTMVCPPSPGWG